MISRAEAHDCGILRVRQPLLVPLSGLSEVLGVSDPKARLCSPWHGPSGLVQPQDLLLQRIQPERARLASVKVTEQKQEVRLG